MGAKDKAIQERDLHMYKNDETVKCAGEICDLAQQEKDRFEAHIKSQEREMMALRRMNEFLKSEVEDRQQLAANVSALELDEIGYIGKIKNLNAQVKDTCIHVEILKDQLMGNGLYTPTPGREYVPGGPTEYQPESLEELNALSDDPQS